MDRNFYAFLKISEKYWSLSARRAWIEIYNLSDIDNKFASLSARRAWIEIYDGLIASANFCVALRKESVDRNTLWEVLHMDRWLVALRKESVDRNFVPFDVIRPAIESLSARRAWIEISTTQTRMLTGCVALRKESVDRNAE